MGRIGEEKESFITFADLYWQENKVLDFVQRRVV